jgi:hypothetical protein
MASGKPTVVSFATPLLCGSRMCGPVVDEQLLVFDELDDRANFIHVEISPSATPTGRRRCSAPGALPASRGSS